MILSPIPDALTHGKMVDAASTIVAQKLSSLGRVGQITVGGSSLPAVAVPVSLVGTFHVTYGAGHSLNNLALMAMTIATSFVFDDAIGKLKDVTQPIEQGMTPFDAASKGARGELHGGVSVDVDFVNFGMHSDSLDGQHYRRLIARICGDSVGRDSGAAGRFAHDHTDDVRTFAAR